VFFSVRTRVLVRARQHLFGSLKMEWDGKWEGGRECGEKANTKLMIRRKQGRFFPSTITVE
jgi:hypothetical protein